MLLHHDAIDSTYLLGPWVLGAAGEIGVVPADTTIVLDNELPSKVYRIIDRVGKSITLYSLDGLDSQAIKSTPPYPVTKEMLADELLRAGDALLWISDKGLTVVSKPEATAKVKFDGVGWRIVKVVTVWSPKGAKTIHGLTLRRYGKTDFTPATSSTKIDKRLGPKVKRIVLKYGVEVTFTVWTPGTYNPATLGVTGGSEASASTQAIISSRGDDLVLAGEVEHHGRLILYLHGHELAFTPVTGQEVEIAGVKGWRVETEGPIYTGEQVGLWELEVVR